MKKRSHFFHALAFSGCLVATGWTATPLAATPRSPAPPVTAPRDRTVLGNFQTSDGGKGTFAETYTVVGSVETDLIVYTLANSTETSTVTTVSTLNTDGTKTVEFSDLDFGATTAFTSTTTYTVSTDGSAVGTGTFVAVDGTTGTLTSILARTGPVNVNSIHFTSAAGALTRQVRLETKGGDCDTLKVVDVDVLGTLTSKTIFRFDGMHRSRP